jgi:hypothetical protein
MLVKNLKTVDLWTKIPIRITLDWIAALKFLMSGQANHGGAVIKAHVALVGSFTRQLKKRKTIRQTQNNPSTIYKRSIVYDYYIGNKQVYRRLSDQ